MAIGTSLYNKSLYRSYKLYLNNETGINKDEYNLTKWLKDFKNQNDNYITDDNTLIVRLGSYFLDKLKDLGFIQLTMKRVKTFDKFTQVLMVEVSDMIKETQPVDDNKIFSIPLKLPMVVKPKEYHNNKLGGYLLNDINYANDIFIKKFNYSNSSTIKNDKIYNRINKLMLTPFKINKSVYDFIRMYGVELGIIFDVKKPHRFESIKKEDLTDYQGKIL